MRCSAGVLNAGDQLSTALTDASCRTYYMVAKPFGDSTSHGAYTLIAATAN